jgi:hypothetical protein
MTDSDIELEKIILRLNNAESRIIELECFANKVVNWNKQFPTKERCDIGSLGQQRHFQSLARRLLNIL